MYQEDSQTLTLGSDSMESSTEAPLAVLTVTPGRPSKLRRDTPELSSKSTLPYMSKTKFHLLRPQTLYLVFSWMNIVLPPGGCGAE